MQFRFQNLDLKTTLNELAGMLDSEVKSENNFCEVKIPHQKGEGIIHGISLDNGLNYTRYRGVFKQDYIFKYSVESSSRLVFFFNLKDTLQLELDNSTEVIELNTYQNIILSIPKGMSYSIRFNAEQAFELNVLDLLATHFSSHDLHPHDYWEKLLQNLVEHSSNHELYCHQGGYSLKCYDVLREIDCFNRQGLLKFLFYDAKVEELLVLQLLQFEMDLEDPSQAKRGRALEAILIAKACKLIRDDLMNIRTAKSLATKIGTNTNKLQSGFKRLYGQSINQYLHAKRLERARDLLVNSDYNISEIVYKIGLSSKSYFSKIFGEHYGLNPSEYRAKNRNKL